MKHTIVLPAEIRLIALGVGQELLRIVHLDWLVRTRRPSKRLIGSSLLSATGGAIRVLSKDPQVKDRYVVQREDGTLFTLAKSTILRRRT